MCYSYFMALPKVYAFTLTQKEFSWHNEDSYSASKKFPIYAVADGVTMPPLEELLAPSESKLAADIFCRKSVDFLEEYFKHKKTISTRILKEAYEYANNAVKKLNTRRDFKLSSTAMLAAATNGTIFGARLCDCGFVLFREGKTIFKTPEFWSRLKKSGKHGYGVIDGNPASLKYIDFYKMKYKKGDILALFSDGFENHVAKQEFVSLFKRENLNKIEKKIKKVDSGLVTQNPEKFGHERTILITGLH